MADSSIAAPIHVAVLPSSGMGHLIPSLRLAANLHARGYTVTLISIFPTISSAESPHLSHFFSTFPQIRHLEFHLLPFDTSINVSPKNHFVLQWESIRRSAHLLPPLLASTSPSISALVVDITLAASILNVVADLPFSKYVLVPTSAAMLALNARFPIITQLTSFPENRHVQIPGLPPYSNSDIPPELLHSEDLLWTHFIENGLALMRADGVIINTFDALEPDVLAALNKEVAVPALPLLFAVGPLEPCGVEGGDGSAQGAPFSWLNEQPARSVVYVSFGSIATLSGDQIKQLAEGLKLSNCRFLWVVKGKTADEEDRLGVGELVGDEFLESVRGRGLVQRDWVEQWKVLVHPAVGGFVSHCGWNSVTEAMYHGVPVLAWPQAADQRINAGIVERSGLGIWERKWGWGGEKAEVVMGSEIGEKVRELMNNAGIKASAARAREEARRAVSAGGTSFSALMKMLGSFGAKSNKTKV